MSLTDDSTISIVTEAGVTQNGTTALGGSFTLSLTLDSTAYETVSMPFDVSARDLEAALETALSAPGALSVRLAGAGSTGRSWVITFAGADGSQASHLVGDMPDLDVTTTSLRGTGRYADVVEVVSGTVALSGTFTLGFTSGPNAGAVTRALDYDASANQVREQVERLGSFDYVLVTRTLTSTDGGNAYDWRVTFAARAGNVDDMTATSALTGTSADVEVCLLYTSPSPRDRG